MKVILHIGDSKCGSSSIQAGLLDAREDLLARGILYHPANHGNGHFSYITLLNGQTRSNDDEQQDLARRNLAETAALVARHHPDCLLISAENLYSVAPDEIMALLRQITAAPLQLHVVAFVRHPVAFYLSSVQQTLKADHVFLPPEKFIRDTTATFQRWSATAACAGITVRLFDRARLRNQSVVADFSQILRDITGQDLPDLPDQSVNTSLSAEQMVVLQSYRRDFLADQAGLFAPDSNRLRQFFEELNQTAGLLGNRPTLRPGVQACIMAQNARFVQALDRMFPSLGMEASYQVEPRRWDPSRWTQNVASILKPVDARLVARLKRLLPDYRDELQDEAGVGLLRARLHQMRFGPAARRAYLRYLDRSGRQDLSESLRGFYRKGALPSLELSE